MMYLGSLGRMIGLRCSSALNIDHGDRYTLSRTVEGGVRAQVRPVAPRQWSVGWGDLSTPADLAVLQDFANGAWGNGPWQFLSDEAVNTNILTPRQASLLDREEHGSFADGGPVTGSDGLVAPRSVVSALGSGWVPLFSRVPVKPGDWLTWAADVQGDGQAAPELSMAFYNSNGGNIGGHPVSGEPITGVQRVAVSRVVPEAAAWVNVGIRHTVIRVTRPQVTWTEHAPSRVSDGRGCDAAVLHQVRQGLVLTRPERTYVNADFVVSEVM